MLTGTIGWLFQFAGTKLADQTAVEEQESDEEEEETTSTIDADNEQITTDQTNGNGNADEKSKFFTVFQTGINCHWVAWSESSYVVSVTVTVVLVCYCHWLVGCEYDNSFHEECSSGHETVNLSMFFFNFGIFLDAV